MSTDDALDPKGDPFYPPAIPTLVFCLHCQQEYDSYRIEWRVETDQDGRPHGFWCCPIENCDGKGFGFDIFPVDPDYRNEDGEKMWCDDAEEDGSCLDEEPESTDGPDAGSKRLQQDDDESLPW